MTDDGSNVIRLRPEQDASDEDRLLKMRSRDAASKRCVGLHQRVELDGQAERVYCRDCGTEVPAFKALESLARAGERYIAHRLEAERRWKVVSESLRDLEKRERNAKSRVRNWTKKAPPCECAFREKKYSPGPWCPMCGGVRDS